MKRLIAPVLSSVFWIVQPAFAQLPALGDPPKPAPSSAAPAGMSVEAVNTDLKTARAANAEKRYADAEALMLKDTAAKPNLPYPWIELGQAQLGQKKYDEAEVSFKAALNGGAAQPDAKADSGSFYAADGKATHSGQSLAIPDAAPKKRDPDAEGVSWSSLGEVYIRTNRAPEAQAAFDQAVKANPAQAALYLGNETILFFQTGNSTAQLDAANKALAIDPTRAKLYYFKAQALTTQASVDPKTQKLVLPPGCLEAYQKYLELDPDGQFANDSKSIIAAAGASFKPVFKPNKK
jgi:tetratricopeptide (TPR) repeat protein